MRKIIYMCCIVIGSIITTGCTKEEMKLKAEEYQVEYGKSISSDVKTYLDNTDDYMKETKLTGIPENEAEKEYPSIGEYEIVLKNNDQESKVKITIKDTVAPAFKDIKEIYEVEYGKSFDVKNIKAEDLSNIEYTLDDSNVNYKKVGTYDATVTAKDSSGNEAKQNIKIKVKEEKKETTSTSSSSSSSNTNKSSSSTSSKSSSSTSGSSSSSSNSSGSSGSNASSSDNTSSNSSNSSGASDSSSTNEVDVQFSEEKNWHSKGAYGVDGESFEWPSDWDW